ncbi:MAG: hypothetical protein AAFO69_18395, partial [Bacteroidota bacterium]
MWLLVLLSTGANGQDCSNKVSIYIDASNSMFDEKKSENFKTILLRLTELLDQNSRLFPEGRLVSFNSFHQSTKPVVGLSTNQLTLNNKNKSQLINELRKITDKDLSEIKEGYRDLWTSDV